MKKIVSVMLATVVAGATLGLAACGGGKEKVLIYTSTEDYNMEYLQECLDREFPDYDIKIEYMSTSNIAAKVIEEKGSSDCDIIYAEEYGYIEQMVSNGALVKLADFGYDYSVFADDTLETSAKDYLLPTIRAGGAIIVNTRVLQERNLQKPTSYSDLLDSQYKGLISMPSPKSSGTGYMFYLSLVNSKGESEAISYFNDFSANVLAYTTSGSGPVNSLVGREVAVGLGMITQAAEKITAGNNELEIMFFEEGAPFNLYGTSVVIGKEKRECVMKVMDYIYNSYIDAACEKYYPEAVLKNKTYTVSNFPKNVSYADMHGNTIDKKKDLLAKWTH